MALSQTTVLKVYKSVMEDVIAGVREIFLDDGVDEQVLVELRHIWETKLLSSKAIDLNPDPPEPQPPIVTATVSSNPPIASGGMGNHSGMASSLNAAAKKTLPSSLGQAGNNHFQGNPNAQTSGQSNIAPAQQTIITEPNKTVPVQITLPAQAGSNDNQPRVLTIQVPASALQGNQLHSVLSGPVISATMALPLHLATSLLQQHVTTALQGQQQAAAAAAAAAAVAASNNATAGNSVMNNTGMHPKVPNIIQANNVGNAGGAGGVLVLGKGPGGLIRQIDGMDDTSDDEDDDEEEEEDAEEEEENDEKDEEEEEENDGGAEEEPLNSDDDVSDEDPTDLFDTDNVVVCQYDKITRSRNKWKFYLKDGIMNLGGKDFVFQRANGDAEW